MERSDPLNDKNKKTDMISSEEELDKQWKERLQNASVPPPAFVWPEIERALQRKKKAGNRVVVSRLGCRPADRTTVV